MYLKIAKSISFVFLFMNCFSQENTSYKEVDSLSYVAFMNNNWEEAKSIAKVAYKEGVSFYYLHLRVGILAYNIENYDEAIFHFEVANEMNPEDSTCLEYLYYAYVFGGQLDLAQKLAYNQKKSFQNKIGYTDKRKIESIGFSSLNILTDNIQKGKDIRIINSGDLYGSSVFNGRVQGISLNMSHKVSPSVRLINQVALFSSFSNSREVFNINAHEVNREYVNKQFQYNFVGSYLMNNKLDLAFGLALFKMNADYSTTQLINSPNVSFLTNDIPLSYSNSLFSFSISKKYRYIKPKLEMGYNNLYNKKQFQVEGEIIVFPFGNNKVYSQTSFVNISREYGFNYVLNQKMGMRLNKYSWLELGTRLGDLTNYQTSNGLIIYNSADKVKQEFSLFFNLFLKKVDVSLGYAIQAKEGIFFSYSNEQDYSINRYNYTSNNIITVVKWKF